MTEVRQEVVWFSEVMEDNLQLNDYKGGWEKCSILWLLAKLNEEIGEVADRIIHMHWNTGELDFPVANSDVRHLQNECADAANVLMMIADNAGRYKE